VPWRQPAGDGRVAGPGLHLGAQIRAPSSMVVHISSMAPRQPPTYRV
jgi:hypothetical protein